MILFLNDSIFSLFLVYFYFLLNDLDPSFHDFHQTYRVCFCDVFDFRVDDLQVGFAAVFGSLFA